MGHILFETAYKLVGHNMDESKGQVGAEDIERARQSSARDGGWHAIHRIGHGVGGAYTGPASPLSGQHPS